MQVSCTVCFVVDVDMSGTVALVTGGSRGLGCAMVPAFAEHGADVMIASRKLDNCEKLANEVRERFRRIGEPNEIIGAALCFASDASSCTTGSIRRIDGGMK